MRIRVFLHGGCTPWTKRFRTPTPYVYFALLTVTSLGFNPNITAPLRIANETPYISKEIIY